MEKPVIIIGIGEIGGVFARGFLKRGYPVYPTARNNDISAISQEIPDPVAVIAAVGEKDFASVLSSLPKTWHNQLVLVQNELLPRDWKAHKVENPTVISIWFEKKYPQDFKVIIPSPVYGSRASLIKDALDSLAIPVRLLKNEEELLFELILKNLYILTINIAGLKAGGNVYELWAGHEDFARRVANDVLDIQFWLAQKTFDREQLIQAMVKAFEGDPQHKCLGRFAPQRLERAIQLGEKAGLKISTLREIYSKK